MGSGATPFQQNNRRCKKKLEADPEKYAIFEVAELLGMLVVDIEERMPPDELIYWFSYFQVKNAKIEKKRKEEDGKQKNKTVVSKRHR